MISDRDRQLVATWVEHGLPRDQRTLDAVPVVLARLLRAYDELAASVDELFDGEGAA